MEIVNKKENVLVLKMKTNETLANALRRSVFEIPTNAIEEIDISKNDSALYDETIAHRIGLIPLKYKKGEHKIKLKVKGPATVYSGDIKSEAEVIYEKMPITILREGQEIDIKGKTSEGIGKDHSKFLPGIVFYRIVSEITVDKEVAKKIKENCPELNFKDKGNKSVIIDDGEKSCLDFIEGVCEKEKKEFEIKDLDEIILTVESFGQIKVEDIFKKSLEILKKNLGEVEKKIK